MFLLYLELLLDSSFRFLCILKVKVSAKISKLEYFYIKLLDLLVSIVFLVFVYVNFEIITPNYKS